MLDSKRIPALREDPINPVIAYRMRSKDYAKPELKYLQQHDAPLRFPRPNPQHVLLYGASNQRDLMPAEPKLDVVLAYKRYPALNDKQSRRWTTESKDQFVNRFPKRR